MTINDYDGDSGVSLRQAMTLLRLTPGRPWEPGRWEVMEQHLTGQYSQFSERFLQILWNERHLAPDLRCQD